MSRCVLISDNSFNGTLPESAQLGWTNLQSFQSLSNRLSGTLSDGIGSGWSQLTSLLIRDNQFSGTLPASLSQWSNILYVFLLVLLCLGCFYHLTLPFFFDSLQFFLL